MKALYFTEHGEPDLLQFGDITDAYASSGEVVVRVKAASLNHLDIWVLRGWKGLTLRFPHTGGADVAGVLHQGVIPGVQIGDPVVVSPGFAVEKDRYTEAKEDSLSPNYQILGETRQGGFAEYITVPAAAVFPMPQNLNFEEAASMLLVSLTAWRMLERRARLRPGETVLIVGSGGGVNSISIQLAKALGAKVFALAGGSDKARHAASLGADHVIDYTRTANWAKEIRALTEGVGVDVVVDNVGAKTMAQSLQAVIRGGRIVTVGNTSGAELVIDNRYIFGKQLSILGSTMGGREDFLGVLALMSQGTIKPIIDEVFPLERGAAAYQKMIAGTHFGKLVLTV